MAIELRQQLKLSQQLVMTPQLQQAIKLLQLSRLELVDMIQQELEENPALDEVPPEQDMPEGPQESAKPEGDGVEEVHIDEKISEDIDWDAYLDEYNSPGRMQYESEEKEAPKYEAFISSRQSLEDHLLWQFLMTSPSPEEEKIGSAIIGNISQDGYLDITIPELAELTESDPEKVESILSMIQTFDPVGVAARNLAECLRIQAEHLGVGDSIVIDIIDHHIKNLENKNYKAIAKALKVGIPTVLQAVEVIRSLEPKPGRRFNDEEPIYITPDIYVYKMEDDFVIVLNDDGMPRLHVNPYYRQAVKQGSEIPDSAKSYLQDKMRSAAWLIKSIQQRQKTIYNVMESIVKFQRDFFEKGIAYLKPMVLRDVAEDIEMHESTISRVTTNKYAYTPQGIFELKYFFNSSINRVHGSAIASASVMDKIRQIIENENPQKPLSDERISEILRDSNVDIARRTVAKYREMMKILPSNKRKQY